jgi:hypothetical protein
MDEPKYPGCTVELSGTSAHAVTIFRTVRRELIWHLRDEGMSWTEAEEIGDAFQEEATSGDYDNVLITCMRWVTIT